MNFLNKYGWLLCTIAMIGDLVVSLIIISIKNITAKNLQESLTHQKNFLKQRKSYDFNKTIIRFFKNLCYTTNINEENKLRNRSVVFVIRNKKILMEKLSYPSLGNRVFYSIPGGGIEDGESPEQAAIRELKEECGLDGTIVRKLTELYNNDRTEHVFEVKVPDNQEPITGYDPEESGNDNPPLKEVLWLALDEISEKDRAFLWGYGLIQIEGFYDEVISWGDTISYPKEK